MVGMCRLCASLRKVDSLTKIDDTNDEICEKLRSCCQLDIRMDDALPKSVCNECLERLDTMYSFYTKVHEAQEALTALFPGAESAAPAQSSNESTLAVALAPVLHGRVKRRQREHSVEQPKPRQVKTRLSAEEDSAESVNDEQMESLLDEVYEMLEFRKDECEMAKGGSKPFQKDKPLHRTRNRSKDSHTTEFVLVEGHQEMGEQQSTMENVSEETTKDVDVGSENMEEFENADKSGMESEMDFLEEADEESADVEEVAESATFEDDNEPLLEESKSENESLESHQVSDWNSYNFCCYRCSFYTHSFASLHEHAQSKHRISSLADMQYKCNDCQKICARYNAFLNHVRLRHQPALVLRCDACSTVCSDYAQLAFHRRVVCPQAAEYPPLEQCAECGKAFCNTNGLQLHQRAQHNASGEQQRHKCSICDKEFKLLGSLRAHQRIHSDVKLFNCEICGNSFRHKVNLEVHLYSHVSDKAFKCNICQKNFKTALNLEKHHQVHTDVKHFKCDFCAKPFRTKDEKFSHERIHTGEMPYKCQYCKRRFRFRSTLQSHTTIHTGERPYSCAHCDMHFTNWSNHNKHMKRRHASVMDDGSVTTTTTKAKETSSKKSKFKEMISFSYNATSDDLSNNGENYSELVELYATQDEDNT